MWDLLYGNVNFLDENNGIFIIRYEDKWFWVLILRDYAKHCEEIVINNYDFKIFHRLHINKVMVIRFFAAHFYDTLENGCDVKKSPFISAPGGKMLRDMSGSR